MENIKALFIYVSKLEAAKRQLEMAIRLFFNNEDLVVVHSLTWSAHSVLTDLGKKQGVKPILGSYDMIIPEKREEFRKLIRQAGNFFKHADKDSGSSLKFFFKTTDIYLLDACQMYQTLTNEATPLILIFRSWYHLTTPGMLDLKNEELLNGAKQSIDLSNKAQFFSNMLPVAMSTSRTAKI